MAAAGLRRQRRIWSGDANRNSTGQGRSFPSDEDVIQLGERERAWQEYFLCEVFTVCVLCAVDEQNIE